MSKVCDFVKVEAENLAQKFGYYVVDVEYAKKHNGLNLTIFLDKEGGIGLDDLEKFSREIEPILDANENVFEGSYTLNCSSPGLDRNLKTDTEFKLALGKELVAKFYKAAKPYGKELVGVLKSYDSSSVTLETEKGELVTLDKKDIASICKNIKF